MPPIIYDYAEIKRRMDALVGTLERHTEPFRQVWDRCYAQGGLVEPILSEQGKEFMKRHGVEDAAEG